MRLATISFTTAAVVALIAGSASRADVATLNPIADAFVDSALPNNNYGGAGSLGISAPALPQGEFRSVMRFDTTASVAGFNTTYGAGNWTIQSITLRLTATAPNNGIFNAQAAGQFAARWMQNDTWVEGAGTPMAPAATGITFNTLPSFLGGSDEAIGAFAFDGSTTATATYALTLTSGFTSDVSAGGLVSMHLLNSGSGVSYLFNSRTFNTVASRPALIITAVPAPAMAGLLLASGLAAARRSKRPR